MSTLTISIFALIAFVVGAVLLLNLWQARGNRRLEERGHAEHEHARPPGGFDPMAKGSGRGRAAGDAHGTTGGRRWQPGGDQNAWTRQRREPTLTADDGAAPVVRFAPDAFDPPDQSHGVEDGTLHMSADDGEQGRAVDNDDDLGPPQFEAPRFEPAPFEPAPLESPAFEAPRFDPAALPGNQPTAALTGRAAVASAVAHVKEPSQAGAAAGRGEAGRGETSRGEAARGETGSDGGDTIVDGASAALADEPAFVPADVDHVVTLIPRSPVNAERLIALTSSLRHVGSKSIRIEIDSGQGKWIPLQSGTMVGCLRCSVLLANRQGPLNAVELSDFSAALESLAGQIGARFVAPDMNQVLRQARELDAVAARLDTQVDLGVEAAEPIAPNRLASVARKLDLFDRGGGRFACFGEGGELLYSLMAGESADMLAFVLDVPRTAQSHDPWRCMVACASSCAQLVGGRVVDGAGRGMSVGMIDSVGQQIGKRYQELADVGLKAGTPAALRVFN